MSKRKTGAQADQAHSARRQEQSCKAIVAQSSVVDALRELALGMLDMNARAWLMFFTVLAGIGIVGLLEAGSVTVGECCGLVVLFALAAYAQVRRW